jgi:hypothetical protein
MIEPPSSPDKTALLAELESLVLDWDQEAKARHIDGMAESADTLRACRNELKAIVRRHKP